MNDEHPRPVILPGLLGQAKRLFSQQAVRWTMELDGTVRLVAVTALDAAKVAYLQWLMGACDKDRRALNRELPDEIVNSELTIDWKDNLGKSGYLAVTLIAAQVIHDSPDENLEREQHQDRAEWLRQRHAAQIATDRG